MRKMNIPRCMSTQHPDNVSFPFFAESTEISGEDEIQEAYYAFSHLGCDEQMWDCEGKEVDNYVVKKLLTKYDSFFEENQLGQDVFVTLRVPNPTVEKAEAKVLLETLESIPRSFDAANMFYGEENPPIFEVILPMATSANCIDRVYRYYTDFVIGKQDQPFSMCDITVAEWIGEFKPEKIKVIPLFEDKEHLLAAHRIIRKYLQDKDEEYQRVFLARSDPAMNYGLVSAVLLNKVALQRLQRVSEEMSVDLYPIIGVGSAPFRGNLKPSTAERVMEKYPSIHTFTIQSAFKYDYPPEEVKKGIEKLRSRETGPAQKVDEERCLDIIRRYSQEYREQVVPLTPVINEVARCVPSRRKRKLHVGLFGYSRDVEGINLPRAITFTASLYSIGLPPEILGLNALNDEDLQFVKEVYVHFEDDLKDALQYLNPDTPWMPEEVKAKIEELSLNFRINEEHRRLTDCLVSLLKENRTENREEIVLRAARLRQFLG